MHISLCIVSYCKVGRDSSVGIRLVMGWTVRCSNPSEGEIFPTRPDRPRGHPAACTVGTGSFPGVKWPGRGVDHTPLLMPRLKEK
jgi:hypothetical protein